MQAGWELFPVHGKGLTVFVGKLSKLDAKSPGRGQAPNATVWIERLGRNPRTKSADAKRTKRTCFLIFIHTS